MLVSHKDKLVFLVWAILGAALLPTAHALAANINFSIDTIVSLTSPAVNFTIIANSVADTATVNATSVLVGMSNATGGSFTLTSAAYDLTVTQSGAGSISQTCVSGLATVVLTQSSGSSTYTITPAASQCVAPTPTPTPTPAPSSGGGGGTGLPPVPPTVCSTTATLPVGVSEGDLVRGPDGIKVYIVNQFGYMRHVFNPTVFSFYHHFRWDKVKNLDTTAFAKLKPSELYRADGDEKVYSLQETNEAKGIAQKRWLNMTATDFITTLGFDPNQIFTINAQERDYYQNGTPLGRSDFAYPVRRNQLVQVAGDQTVYFIDARGYKRTMPAGALSSYCYDKQRTTGVTTPELASYPAIRAIMLENGNGNVYLLDGSTKHWVENSDAFGRQGLNWNQVAIVNATEFNAYADGDPIN